MITVIPDGIYCKKCNDLHPTLYWHNKYNDYLLNRREKWEEMIKKHFPQQNIENFPYTDNIIFKELKQVDSLGNCIICNSETFFKSTITDNYVCSDECKYKNEGKEINC